MTEKENKITIKFGIIALILAMVAFSSAVGHFWLGPINPPPKLEDTIANEAVRIRDKVVSKLKGKKEVSPEFQKIEWSADRIMMASIACVSAIAILIAVIGFIRKESPRVIISAVALSSLALALQYFVIALGAIVFAIILAAVLGGLGFS